MNVSIKTVQAWERGARVPSDAALKLRSVSGGSDCRANAASAPRNLAIGCAGRTLLEFIGAIAGKNRMGMRVNEAGEYDASTGVNYIAILIDMCRDLTSATDCLNPVPATSIAPSSTIASCAYLRRCEVGAPRSINPTSFAGLTDLVNL